MAQECCCHGQNFEKWLRTAGKLTYLIVFGRFRASQVAEKVMKIVAGLLMMIAMNHLVACMWFGIASMTETVVVSPKIH